MICPLFITDMLLILKSTILMMLLNNLELCVMGHLVDAVYKDTYAIKVSNRVREYTFLHLWLKFQRNSTQTHFVLVVGVYTGLTNELSIINLFYQGVYVILSIYNYIVKGLVCMDNMIVVSLMCLYYNSLPCN